MTKASICAAFGAIGALIAQWMGGWTATLSTLLIFMLVDYVTGMIVPLFFHNSEKTDTGTWDSTICFKGLFRKGMIMFAVLIGYRMDIVMHTGTFIRDAVCLAYICNEGLSIVENAGLMGIEMPVVIVKALEVLQKRADKNADKIGGDDNDESD